MAQDQELIGLQNDLANNLSLQDRINREIEEKENEIGRLEAQEEELEEKICELIEFLDEADEEIEIDVFLDTNEQGETIQ